MQLYVLYILCLYTVYAAVQIHTEIIYNAQSIRLGIIPIILAFITVIDLYL